jgi:hypothetical protein
MKKKLAIIRGSRAPAKPADPQVLLSDVRELIHAARQTVARGVNAALVMLYWNIGQRLRVEVLNERRADYGKEILSTLSKELVAEFGRGFFQSLEVCETRFSND